MHQFDYVSDIHLDFHCREANPNSPRYLRQQSLFLDVILPDTPSDTLLIAGDIGHYNDQNIHFLKLLKDRYSNVVLVTGNHCQYLTSNSMQSKFKWDSSARIADFNSQCKSIDVHSLVGNAVTIDGTTIAGLPMSWDKTHYNLLAGYSASDAEVREYFNNVMNDARYISDGTEPRKVSTAYGGSYLHTSWNPFTYFESQLALLDAIPYADIMLTHYIPLLYDTMPLGYRESSSSTFYYFNGIPTLDRLKPKCWVFGHTHVPVFDSYRSTRLLCNPIGYPSERVYPRIQTHILGD